MDAKKVDHGISNELSTNPRSYRDQRSKAALGLCGGFRGFQYLSSVFCWLRDIFDGIRYLRHCLINTGIEFCQIIGYLTVTLLTRFVIFRGLRGFHRLREFRFLPTHLQYISMVLLARWRYLGKCPFPCRRHGVFSVNRMHCACCFFEL